jgi:hypothetical protein
MSKALLVAACLSGTLVACAARTERAPDPEIAGSRSSSAAATRPAPGSTICPGGFIPLGNPDHAAGAVDVRSVQEIANDFADAYPLIGDDHAAVITSQSDVDATAVITERGGASFRLDLTHGSTGWLIDAIEVCRHEA